MEFNVTHQEQYSRGELLLRTFFGWLYIAIPHILVLIFYSLWVFILMFLSWFIILFTGKTPKSYYEAQVKLNKWSLRLSARLYNLSDGYPAIGPNGTDDKTVFSLEPYQISRGELLLRSLLGIFYVGIPHGICLYVRSIATLFLTLFAWFAVLFTGKYPANWHNFNVGTLRWQARVNMYMSWLLKDYPPFSGRPDNMEGTEKPIDMV